MGLHFFTLSVIQSLSQADLDRGALLSPPAQSLNVIIIGRLYEADRLADFCYCCRH